ncbi:MAG TPA: hypothetical protein VF158_08155, partial [Longimicrobiales bacterium]
MATREWIEDAALKERRPVGRGTENSSIHLLDGALVVDQVEQARAARYLQRQSLPPIPDPTDPDKVVHVREILGLPEVPVPASADAIIGHDVIEVLLRTLRRDGEAAARQWLAGLDPDTLRLA